VPTHLYALPLAVAIPLQNTSRWHWIFFPMASQTKYIIRCVFVTSFATALQYPVLDSVNFVWTRSQNVGCATLTFTLVYCFMKIMHENVDSDILVLLHACTSMYTTNSRYNWKNWS